MARTEIFGFRGEETMQRTILMVLSTMLMSGCAGLMPSTDCDGQGSPPVKVMYGDSQLRVNPPIAHVHRGGDFVLDLQPVGPGADSYKSVDVTVVGKTADDNWITPKTESYNSAANNRIIYCVPPMQDTVEYEYIVTVDTVGNLDPRVKVNN